MVQPSVATADGNYNGNIRFGSNRAYMTERTAMHEISHTLGIGQTAAFDTKCAANDWATATPLLKSWDGSSAKINCGGGHIWPYGLNVSFSLRLAAHLVLFAFITVLIPLRPMSNAYPRKGRVVRNCRWLGAFARLGFPSISRPTVKNRP